MTETEKYRIASHLYELNESYRVARTKKESHVCSFFKDKIFDLIKDYSDEEVLEILNLELDIFTKNKKLGN